MMRKISRTEVVVSWLGIPFVFAILYAIVAYKAFMMGYRRIRARGRVK